MLLAWVVEAYVEACVEACVEGLPFVELVLAAPEQAPVMLNPIN